jgi:hypothetical protein
VCRHHGDAGGVGVLAAGVKLGRYVISWNLPVLSWLSTLRINAVGGNGIDANGRNGGLGHSKTVDA